MTELQRLEVEILSYRGRLNFRPSLDAVRELGTRLLRVKSLVGHGGWQSWLARLGFKARTAQTYMQVAKTPSPAGLADDLSLDGLLGVLRAAKRAARRHSFAAPGGGEPVTDPDWAVVTADCRTHPWPEVADVVATDPPWSDADAYSWLAGFASARLRDGGLLLVQCGVAGLAGVLETARGAGLVYRHTLSITYSSSSGSGMLMPFICNWVPVLIFSKGRFDRSAVRACSDVVTVSPTPKKYHPWEQPIKPWLYWLERLTSPGHLVLDPFAGGATIGVACRRLGRRYLGTESDPEYARTARIRLAEGAD